jgi:ABC-type transporter Mla subunit MlaD
MRRLVSILLVAAVCVGAFVLSAAGGEGRKGKSYRVELDNAFGLVEGGDLKVGGVKAGRIAGFKLSDHEPYRSLVEVEVSEPGFDSLRTDAHCDVRQQSLIGEYFIDCDLGKAAKELPSGGVIPVKQTSSTVPPDLINTVMRRPYRERFRLIISELGVGLAGRPRELNEVIRRAHPALRETTQTLAILRRQNKVIRDFIRDADTVSAHVEPVKDQLARWANEAADTSGIQASRSEELGRYWNRLPEFLRQLEPTMAELEKTADRQIPTLRKLGGAAPELDRFIQEAQPFARASRKSIDDLGSAAKAGREALGQSRDEIKELRALSVNAPKLGKPLRQFLQAIDDRKRSIENDPTAAATAPPAPDKTAYKAGQGFTGMEAFWNYVYWQTLAINGFDEFGHILRLILINNSCGPYSAKPTEALQKQCASWTGPNQPGVNAPDPTEGTNNVAAQERAQRRSSTRAQRERRRGPGEPQAPPTPGQPDPSKPHVVLPDGVKQLLDGLRGPLPKAPAAPQLPRQNRADGDAGQLLDYLLGP